MASIRGGGPLDTRVAGRGGNGGGVRKPPGQCFAFGPCRDDLAGETLPGFRPGPGPGNGGTPNLPPGTTRAGMPVMHVVLLTVAVFVLVELLG